MGPTQSTMRRLLAEHASTDRRGVSTEAGNRGYLLADDLAFLLCCCTFEELLEAAHHGYVPTLRGSDEAEALADAYDYAQARRGRDHRAHRGPAATRVAV